LSFADKFVEYAAGGAAKFVKMRPHQIKKNNKVIFSEKRPARVLAVATLGL
jgi:hypothetical protein